MSKKGHKLLLKKLIEDIENAAWNQHGLTFPYDSIDIGDIFDMHLLKRRAWKAWAKESAMMLLGLFKEAGYEAYDL